MQTRSYPDIWMRIIGSIFLAHFIKMLGHTQSLWEIVMHAEYFKEVLIGGLINFSLWSLIRWVSIRLDRHYDWLEASLLRAFLQATLGFVVPMLFSFFVMYLFFMQVVGDNIFNSSWLYVEYRVVLFYIAMMNCFYLAYYFYQRFRHADAALQLIQNQPAVPQVLASPPAASNTQVIIAARGSRQVPVPVEEIAYCFLQDDIYYLKTFDEQQLMSNETLDELANLLPTSQFFRINRQILASAKACASFRSIANGKLEVMLQPNMPEPTTVSQKKAAAFKSWLVNR
ncbi:MAG: LytTR family DNA-binding domain-containing protein [Haliscomenobacter sp.]|uniref:LytTR family DNA-binding domain-containing protein n=1 Tax=Haliscomenobacter sp. TaxID=2717303 RepID=UPI0029A8926B|nr:LytTR family DNA-binding domain-containing protein [Haliscomenobacter sp.]MDX2071371.1 LytTR family DNA-binding domain-containing protein [Haliscomenobacter sp.]